MCVCEGEKRPITHRERSSVQLLLFSVSVETQERVAIELMLDNELGVCVCVCVKCYEAN